MKYLLLSSVPSMPIPLKPLKKPDKAIKNKSILEKLIEKIAYVITNYPKRILISGIILVLIASLGITLVKVDVNYKTFFKPGTEIRESMEFIDNEMAGSLNIVFRIEDEMKNPVVIKEMEKNQFKTKFTSTYYPNPTPSWTVYERVHTYNPRKSGFTNESPS